MPIAIDTVMNNWQTQCRLQWRCLAGMESANDTPPSALLTATTTIMHNVVARFKTASGLEELFTTSLSRAWSAFADSLPDKLMLCACLGALHHELECNSKVCSKIMDLGRHRGLHELILNTLEEVVQVQFSVMVMYSNTTGL